MAGGYVQPNSVAKKLGGTVADNSLVKFSAGTPDDVVEKAGAGERAIGVVQKGGSTGSTVEVDLPGGGSELKISATVTRGQYLKADADGFGTPGTTAADYCPVQAMASGVANDIIPVFVHPVVIAAAE